MFLCNFKNLRIFQMLSCMTAATERIITFYVDSPLCHPVAQRVVLIFQVVFVLNDSRRDVEVVDEMRHRFLRVEVRYSD